jgi:DNA-binding SARP family transcriptional activator
VRTTSDHLVSGSGEAYIIRRKVAPPALPDRFAERPRLQLLLADLIGRKRLVIVTGAAGAGKTTAVADATRLYDAAVAWLTIDHSDVAPGRLVTYLEASVRPWIPGEAEVATRALAAGLTHAEAAGLLAESIHETRSVLVLDELERLGSEPAPWRVIEAFLRYLPESTTVVLISRRDIPTGLCELPSLDAVATIGDGEVAFTVEEAERALAACGKELVDAHAAVASTAGWVTGVLFEAWKSGEHIAGLGGESDPLNGYLAAEILGQLAADERDFLIETSLLDEVTVARAEALGTSQASRVFGHLRSVHLPATWSADRNTMRPHPRLRQYLLQCLERRGGEEVRRIRAAHARLLAGEGEHESATEEFLRAGLPEEAVEPACRAIVGIVKRLDFEIAERWLLALQDVAPRGASSLATAELMMAISRDEPGRAVHIADQLAALGERETLAAASEHAAWLMIWAYIHTARWDGVEAIMATVPDGPALDAVQYTLTAVTTRPGKVPPPAFELLDGPLQALARIAQYQHGDLADSREAPETGWEAAVLAPWRIAALRALGLTEQALELYESGGRGQMARGAMVTMVAPDLLIDARQRDDARRVIDEARRMAAAGGSLAYAGLARVAEAKLALRLDHDPRAAMAALDQPDCRRSAAGFSFIQEIVNTWYGLALLLTGRDEEALALLREAVSSMMANGRILDLATAAVYLAEAEWRAGDEDAADRAAALALSAAGQQGSNHLLLQALADFPAVVSRRIDIEENADSPWHAIGRDLSGQGLPVAVSAHLIDLAEFGQRKLTVDGEISKPRTAKSYELLAYLLATPSRTASRSGLLDALFDGRNDDSARAYLRQAIRWLRMALPENVILAEGSVVRVDPATVLRAESGLLETKLAEAARLQGAERLDATLSALQIHERGPYLPGPRGRWAEEREQWLAELTTEARFQAAEIALELGRYEESDHLITEVLRLEPYRESAWRLQMRMAGALGDDVRVMKVFRACREALDEVGMAPGPTTQQLLGQLCR